MARNNESYVGGTATGRRTEADYMGAMLDSVSLADWKEVVNASVSAAKAGDPGARLWLSQYLIGRAGATAPTPLTIVVDQLSGRDARVEKLAQPHIERVKYPSLHRNDDIYHELEAQIAAEVVELEVQGTDAARTSDSVRTNPHEPGKKR